MYALILTAVLVGLFVLYYRRSRYHKANPHMVGQTTFFTALAVVLGNLILLAALFELMPTRTAIVERPLASMRTSGSVNGSFFLGSGVVGSQVSYHFYLKNADGSLTPHQIAAGPLVRILEDASLRDSGVLEEVYSELDTSSPLSQWTLKKTRRKELLKQVIRVPVGTVLQTFSAQ